MGGANLEGHSESLSQRAVQGKTDEKQRGWPPRLPGKTNSFK